MSEYLNMIESILASSNAFDATKNGNVVATSVVIPVKSLMHMAGLRAGGRKCQSK